MGENIYVGKCPVCRGYGMLEVVVDTNSNDFSVMCEECSAEWKNPEDALRNIKGFRGTFAGQKVRNATLEEIKRIGWQKYIV